MLSRESIKKYLLIASGTVAMVFGVLGMFLPVLPTTPFLLLAAACYSRSSDRFYQWLIQNRYFGEYIRNYREGRGMLLSQKILTLALLWISIGATVYFALPHLWQKILVIAIASAVTIHLARIKRYRPDQSSATTELKQAKNSV